MFFCVHGNVCMRESVGVVKSKEAFLFDFFLDKKNPRYGGYIEKLGVQLMTRHFPDPRTPGPLHP